MVPPRMSGAVSKSPTGSRSSPCSGVRPYRLRAVCGRRSPVHSGSRRARAARIPSGLRRGERRKLRASGCRGRGELPGRASMAGTPPFRTRPRTVAFPGPGRAGRPDGRQRTRHAQPAGAAQARKRRLSSAPVPARAATRTAPAEVATTSRLLGQRCLSPGRPGRRRAGGEAHRLELFPS